MALLFLLMLLLEMAAADGILPTAVDAVALADDAADAFAPAS